MLFLNIECLKFELAREQQRTTHLYTRFERQGNIGGVQITHSVLDVTEGEPGLFEGTGMCWGFMETSSVDYVTASHFVQPCK